MAAVVGVLITLAGVVIALLSFLGGDKGPRNPGPATLKAVALVVHNGDVGTDPSLDVQLHNVGGRRAVVTKARITVERVDSVPVCFSAGALDVSGRYSATLPDRPGVVEVPLHQQIGRDQADRLSITLGATKESLHLNSPPSRKLLYRLRLALLDDSGGQPADAGTALVSVPGVPEGTEDYWPRSLQSKSRSELAATFGGSIPYASFVPCWRANNARLHVALSAPGARSPELDQLRGQLATKVEVPQP